MSSSINEKYSGFDPEFDHAFAQLRKDFKAFIYVIEIMMWCRRQTGMAADPAAIDRLTGVVQEHLARRIDIIYNE